VFAIATIGSMVGIIVGERIGSGVIVAVGSGVFVRDGVTDAGIGDTVRVGVSVEVLDDPHPVNRENTITKTSGRTKFKGFS